MNPWPLLRDYALATLFVGVALALRYEIDRFWGDEVPYATFYLAVLAAVWLTGKGPTVFTILASLVLGDYFFTTPRYTIGFTSTGEWLNALFFAVVSVGVLVTVGRENRALARERAMRLAYQDRSEQLRDEQSLRDAILQGTDVLLCYLDTDFNFVMVNPAYASSCRKTPEEMVGKNHFALFPHPENEAIFRKVCDTGQGVSYRDKAFVFPDQPERGTTYWDWSLTPVKAARGKVAGLVFSLSETTQRKLAEQTLRRSEDRWRRIFETANEGIWLLNSGGFIQMVNARMAEILGFTPDELIGRHKTDLVVEADVPVMQQLFERRRAGLADQVDVRFRHKQGHLVWALMCARPIFDASGKFEGALDMFTDITERKRAEIRVDLLAETASQLLRSREPQHVVNALCQKVTSFLDCQVFFNFLIDNETGRLRLNACSGVSEKEAERLQWLDFGTAVCGCAARDGCRIVAEDIQNSNDVRADLVRSMGVQAYACHPLKVQDRVLGTLSFGTRSRPAFTDDELGLMKAVADLVAIAMERKRARAELQSANADLERRVQERTRSLEELTEQLNAFCYTVAHDLRAPLRTQLSFARMLLVDYGDQLEETGKDWAGRIVQAAERQSNILQDLMAHINVSRADLPLGPVSLVSAVQQARADLELELQQKDAVIDADSLDDCFVLANPSSLHLIVQNLLANAVKFVKKGVKPEVRLSTERHEQYVRLQVADNGIGIDSKDIAKIFGPFQRLNRTSEYPGTGLGLAIVRKAAERMGGRVGVESEPGRGSRFWIELPLAPGL